MTGPAPVVMAQILFLPGSSEPVLPPPFLNPSPKYTAATDYSVHGWDTESWSVQVLVCLVLEGDVVDPS